MPNLEVRLTTIEDYTELVSWWKYHRWNTPPTLDMLDNLQYGLMISHEGENICAGFLYFTNAKTMGWLEFIVSTYKVKDREIRKESLILLIECIKQMAKEQGIKNLFSSLVNQSLIEHYKNCGFIVTCNKSTELICKL